MQPWTAPDLPSLPGEGATLRLWDTASGGLRLAADGPTARMYVCGITPYDATHLGHANTYVAFDLVNRVWRDGGLAVTYVQNVTDVDDPLLERATATGVDWRDLAARETALFFSDMTSLRVIPPEAYVGAVESIPLVVELVEQLRETGAAYQVDDDWYFSVAADDDFGSLSGLDRETMVELFGERGGDPQRPGKKDPLDCLLWLAERPGEPAWDSSLGRGRPGWHIECAAIALDQLGFGIDVQGGGSDLVFPHHEMSASEADVIAGARPFARTFVHSGMVGLHGQKMSKSLGNLELVSRLVAGGEEPMAIRLALLGQHYRSDWEWSDEVLAAGRRRLTAWWPEADRLTGVGPGSLLEDVRAALGDDLDTPRALALIDAWVANPVEQTDGPPLADLVDALLGVALR